MLAANSKDGDIIYILNVYAPLTNCGDNSTMFTSYSDSNVGLLAPILISIPSCFACSGVI